MRPFIEKGGLKIETATLFVKLGEKKVPGWTANHPSRIH